MNIEDIIQKLKINKYRITEQRRTILDIMDKHQDVLLTIEELLTLCQEQNPEINVTTIYRNIEVLDRLELLYKVNVNRNTTAYKIICGNHHHHHIQCLKCGRLEPINYCPLSEKLNDLIELKDFTLIKHNLELYGLCNECKESQEDLRLS